MNCKNCNAEFADDAKFCPQCGARVDGKTECRFCGREIEENAVFCMYCGRRLDGKSVCKKCGNVFEGNFCPNCGAAVNLSAATSGYSPAAMNASASAAIAVDERRAAARMRANHVMAVIKQSLLYGALCVLFICSFFVTLSMTATVSGESGSVAVNNTSFYFLIDIFEEMKDSLAAMGTLGEDYFLEMEISLYLMAGLCAASVGAIILICLGYFIAGTVAFARAMTGKREIAMSKYVIMPAVLSLVLMIFLKGIFGIYLNGSSAEAKITIGAVPIVNIVLVSCLLAGAAVLHIVIGGKSEKDNALGYALQSAGALLAFLAIVLLTLSVLSIEEGRDSAGVSAPGMFLGILSAIGLMADAEQVAAANAILVDSAVVFALYAVVFALAAVAMAAFAKGIVKKSGSSRVMACVFSGISFGVSIAYLVMSIVLCNDSATPAKIGASPICALIFSAFMLAMAIVNVCLLRKKSNDLSEGAVA